MRTDFPNVNAMGAANRTSDTRAGGNDSTGRLGETRATGIVAEGRFGGSRDKMPPRSKTGRSSTSGRDRSSR